MVKFEHANPVKIHYRRKKAAPGSAPEWIEADVIYVLTGGLPRTKWLENGTARAATDDKGFLLTDIYLGDRQKLIFETDLPGVFAVGDVRVKSQQQVGQAVGQGVAAVAAMEDYLKDHWSKVLIDKTRKVYQDHKVADEAKAGSPGGANGTNK
ncbi:FAD-dependent oxidoreductase [Streptomyces sp. C36]|uniref:FAD-dependent oxidoreductase n=1 Tax=Streptomyces sp. C36 TaxID=3237122 RepID=UPI0034C6392C